MLFWDVQKFKRRILLEDYTYLPACKLFSYFGHSRAFLLSANLTHCYSEMCKILYGESYLQIILACKVPRQLNMPEHLSCIHYIYIYSEMKGPYLQIHVENGLFPFHIKLILSYVNYTLAL